ncbi:hypothetical protein VTN77DRAFT_4337 [Rasamsonia byssochlamydoides]|uniref:uncharacterized protein n=1 Tax=Rasamsonia byssochlamydoides TaxID=89139 RepID=UPI0037435BC4
MGVKLPCHGERKLHGADAFVSVEVPKSHPIILNATAVETFISPISKMVGLPVQARKLSSNRLWDQRLPIWDENMGPLSNHTACMLFLEPRLDNSDWGFAPMYWQSEIGDVLLVRIDQQDLTVQQAKVLCYFCEKKLRPLFEDALGGGFVQRTRQEVVDLITPENLNRYQEELVQMMGDCEDEDEDAFNQ